MMRDVTDVHSPLHMTASGEEEDEADNCCVCTPMKTKRRASLRRHAGHLENMHTERAQNIEFANLQIHVT
jgi:hypothetical protein